MNRKTACLSNHSLVYKTSVSIDFFLPQFWKSEDLFVVNLRFISSQTSANAFLDYVIDGTALASRFRS